MKRTYEKPVLQVETIIPESRLLLSSVQSAGGQAGGGGGSSVGFGGGGDSGNGGEEARSRGFAWDNENSDSWEE